MNSFYEEWYPCTVVFSFEATQGNVGDMLKATDEFYQSRLEDMFQDRYPLYTKLSGFACEVTLGIQHEGLIREQSHSKILIPLVLDALSLNGLARVVQETISCSMPESEDDLNATELPDNVIVFPTRPKPTDNGT